MGEPSFLIQLGFSDSQLQLVGTNCSTRPVYENRYALFSHPEKVISAILGIIITVECICGHRYMAAYCMTITSMNK